ncbi:MAG TPA: hypothetical protein PKH04_09685, partial [Burkholderiaceae bacterium]|nr:hypothetical protein [Burkholderiaceae bacterium]HPW06280.1 hypothetical protein [Burkholderiaceae bacterium]
MNYNTPHFKLGLITAAVAALSACGGGAGSISTTVMDGLISNALVCVDANNNGMCDTGETQGRTDSNGRVTLSVAPAEMGTARLVAMIGTDAVDLDTGPVTIPYTLQTPAGKHDVISPLTTMVQAKMDEDKVGSDTAEAHVKSQLGLSVSVFDDYISMRGKGSHKKADLLARLLVVSAKKSRNSSDTSCGSDNDDDDKESHIKNNLLA